MMQDHRLDSYLSTRIKKKSGGSSSYFDFVETKIKEEFVGNEDAMEWADPGKDAFEVQVMDDKTAKALKQKYFAETD